MDESTFWWLFAGVAVAAELMTGTFYLLMLAVGLVGAALAASAGATLTAQIAVAAAVGGGAVVLWRWLQLRRGYRAPPAQANPDVNMDVGQTVQIAAWAADGSAQGTTGAPTGRQYTARACCPAQGNTGWPK